MFATRHRPTRNYEILKLENPLERRDLEHELELENHQ